MGLFERRSDNDEDEVELNIPEEKPAGKLRDEVEQKVVGGSSSESSSSSGSSGGGSFLPGMGAEAEKNSRSSSSSSSSSRDVTDVYNQNKKIIRLLEEIKSELGDDDRLL